MIGKDPVQAKAIVNSIRDALGISALDTAKQEEFDILAKSAWSARFPGAVLAIPRAIGATVYYGIASDPAEWRRLRPLLIAFAGPTITQFTGWPEALSPEDPIEALLLKYDFHVVVRLLPGKAQPLPEMAQRSLQRMVLLVSQSPVTTDAAPKSTSQLISVFVDHLNGNDRRAAEQVIEQCRSELRLDALNLTFMKVQLLAHFQDWQGIRSLPNFNSVCHARKSPAVASALLEALYQCELASLNAKDEIEIWRSQVRHIARPLLRLPIHGLCDSGALRLYAMEALDAEPRRHDLETAVLSRRAAIGELATMLEKAGRGGPPERHEGVGPPQEDAIVRVRRAVANAQATENLSDIQQALEEFNELEEAARQELAQSESFKKALKYLQAEVGTLAVPKNWQEWYAKLPDPAFTSAFPILKRAVIDWPACICDSSQIRAIGNALNAVPDVPPALDRLAEALPLLVSWVVDDPDFPRPAMTPMYEALLYHLLVCERRAKSTYESAGLLIRALLSVGLTSSEYNRLLDDCLELAGSGIGVRNVYWLLDIVEESILNPAPDPERRQAFWNEVNGRLICIVGHLTPGQRVSVAKLGITLGWGGIATESPALAVGGDPQLEALSGALAGKTVGIYSLTESAARQAAQALAAVIPSVKVTLSSDKCGTAALKSSAQNSDLFVIATASAKHAATGFIQQQRPKEKATLFASGRGFTSIIRAIEEHCLG